MPSRRQFLAGAAGAAAAVLAAACSDGGGSDAASTTTTSPPPPTTTSTLPPTTTTLPTGPAAFTSRGPTDTSRVALTFHTSGDLDLAGQLLDLLDARGVPITAFIVGEWLDANPTWAVRITGAGHEIANHTYTHPTFGSLSPAAMADEITRCRDVLVRLAGAGGRYFRPSGTADGTTSPAETVLSAAGAAGYRTVLGFDVDPLDYQDPGAAAITQRVLASAAPGSVISLHFDHPGTLEALPAILDGLAARGLQPGTAAQLFGA
jgi:peptidoglycan/xylan/chitin deacetylase (PgdA/CDA1 family)